MGKRINIVLSDDTIRVLDRVAKRGERSSFVDEAIRYYVAVTGQANLREQLKRGAIARAERDLEIASEYFALEQERWPDDQAARSR